MGILYILTIIFLGVGFILFKKSSKELNIIKWICIFTVGILAYNITICMLLGILNIKQNIWLLSIINTVIGAILLYKPIKNHEFQKYKCSKIDIFMIIVLLLICIVMFIKDLYIFNGDVTHVAIDSAIHYRAAEHYSENLRLFIYTEDKTFFDFNIMQTGAYINDGIFMNVINSFTGLDKVYIYQLFENCGEYDSYIIVGGFLFEQLEQFVKDKLTNFSNKIELVFNPHFKDFGSGYSLFKGIDAVKEHGDVTFVEGDLFFSKENFQQVYMCGKNVLSINQEPKGIMKNKNLDKIQIENKEIINKPNDNLNNLNNISISKNSKMNQNINQNDLQNIQSRNNKNIFENIENKKLIENPPQNFRIKSISNKPIVNTQDSIDMNAQMNNINIQDNIQEEKNDINLNPNFISNNFKNTTNSNGLLRIDYEGDFRSSRNITNMNYPFYTNYSQKPGSYTQRYISKKFKSSLNNFNSVEWNAFFEGVIEPRAIQLSDAFTNKIFSYQARKDGHKIVFTTNRLQYASLDSKINLIKVAGAYGLLTKDDGREILDMAPLGGEEGSKILQSLNL